MEPTILVADEDPELAETFQCYLVRCGYRVLTASGGVECLSIIRNESPTVIVASVDMPWGGADGLVDYLREEYRQRFSPSVILTGSTPDENVSQLLKEPCVFYYLRKPFLVCRLLDCIHAIESDVCGDEPVRISARPQLAVVAYS